MKEKIVTPVFTWEKGGPEALQSLMETQSSRLIAEAGAALIQSDPGLLKLALERALDQTYPVNMRYAWTAQLYCSRYRPCVDPFRETLVRGLLGPYPDGVLRAFLRIFQECADLTGLEDLGYLLNRCFEWIMNPATALAVRVYSIELLYQISMHEPAILVELESDLRFLLENDPPPSLKSRIKSVQSRIRKRHRLGL